MMYWLQMHLYSLWFGGAVYWFTGKSFLNREWWFIVIPTLFFVEVVMK